jgi:thiol-disulfide isomerase/thioredoxin
VLASAAIVAWLSLTVLARRSGVTWPARGAVVLMTALLLARAPAGLRALEQNLNRAADRAPATRPLEELVGQPVPELAFQRLDGTWVQADRAGTLYLVDFWATWCAPCMSEMPELVRLEADLVNTPRFEMISVLADPSDPAPESVLQKLGLGPGDVTRDPQRWMRKLGIGGYPTKLLVRDGQILLARSGGGRGAYALWRGIVERELAGASPGDTPTGASDAR